MTYHLSVRKYSNDSPLREALSVHAFFLEGLLVGSSVFVGVAAADICVFLSTSAIKARTLLGTT